MTEHISKQYDQDLEAIRSRMMQMGGLVEQQMVETIEAEIRFASTASRAAFADDLADAIARLASKYHDDTAPAGRRFRLLAMAHPASTPRSEP